MGEVVRYHRAQTRVWRYTDVTDRIPSSGCGGNVGTPARETGGIDGGGVGEDIVGTRLTGCSQSENEVMDAKQRNSRIHSQIPTV
jgi:hypothetical protein